MAQQRTVSSLISPYGGRLVDLEVSGEERDEWLRKSAGLASIQLTPRGLCDLEMLATGAFSPLDRFMGKADYERVVAEMRLADGRLYPIPVTLSAGGATVSPGQEVALRSPKHELIAVLSVEEVFERDPAEEARQVCGTSDPHHPLAAEMGMWGTVCLSGPVRVLNLPRHFDFRGLRHTPAGVRQALERMGRASVVAFPTRSIIHRRQEEFSKNAASSIDGSLLLQAVTGVARPGDMDYYARLRACAVMWEHHYDRARAAFNLLPQAMRLAGPREILWQAIIQRNFGASHLAVEDGLADPGRDTGDLVYSGGRDLLAQHQDEVGVRILCEDATLADRHMTDAEVRAKYFDAGVPLPESFTQPAVARALADVYPLREHQGFCVWFTGLPSAGKSTIADILAVLLMEHGRQVTVLDGDVVRTQLSKGLGFSKEDRDINILRIGFVASEIVRHNGVVICAAVSPYRATRNQVRSMVAADRFLEVYVATPVEVCEQRDVKRLYAKARAGELKGFTGVDDPYEPPLAPELTLPTVGPTPEENAARIVEELLRRGFLTRDVENE